MVISWDQYNWEEFPREISKRGKQKRGKEKGVEPFSYLSNFGCFDIEATNLPEIRQAVMYIWQFQISKNCTLIGRTWQEFRQFFKELQDNIPTGCRFVVLVHNLSYEFQFLKGVISFDNITAMDRRKILKATNGKTEFRCSYLHSNMSLRKYLEALEVEHLKTELDYNVRRFPWTPLTPKELEYCVNDVQGLWEAYAKEMERDKDDLYSIPLTSTGYIRREAKEATASRRKYIREDLPDARVFTLLREAFRGGNTHANRWNANIIIEAKPDKPIQSWDISSSYPSVLLTEKYPRKFYPGRLSNFEMYLDMGRACLFRVNLYDLKLLDQYWGIPYLAKDKCRNIDGAEYDNGRIIKADSLQTTMTEIDFAILASEYRFDYEVTELYTARKEYLAPEFRKLIMKKYEEKTKLKGVDAYRYQKEKNKFNGLYGMTVQNPCKDDWILVGGELQKDTSKSYEQRVADYQRTGWLNYSTGVWCTCYARLKLEKGLAAIPPEAFLYSDTDSIKFLGDYSKEFEELNSELLVPELSAKDSKGNVHFLGIYEQENTKKPIKRFKTLGAKKYAYEDEDGLHLTLSGVAKEEGAEELGTLENFSEGFIFHEAAGTESRFNDLESPVFLEIDGHTLEIVSNIYIGPSTYKLGLGTDYRRLLNVLASVDFRHKIAHDYTDIMEDDYS